MLTEELIQSFYIWLNHSSLPAAKTVKKLYLSYMNSIISENAFDISILKQMIASLQKQANCPCAEILADFENQGTEHRALLADDHEIYDRLFQIPDSQQAKTQDTLNTIPGSQAIKKPTTIDGQEYIKIFSETKYLLAFYPVITAGLAASARLKNKPSSNESKDDFTDSLKAIKPQLLLESLSLNDNEFHVLINEFKRLPDDILSSLTFLLPELLAFLSPERVEILLRNIPLPQILNDAKLLSHALQRSSTNHRLAIYTHMENHLYSLIHTNEDFIYVIRFLSPELSTRLCLIMKDKLPTLFANPIDISKLFMNLSEEQYPSVCESMKELLETTIRTLEDIALFFERPEWEVLRTVLKDHLLKIIKEKKESSAAIAQQHIPIPEQKTSDPNNTPPLQASLPLVTANTRGSGQESDDIQTDSNCNLCLRIWSGIGTILGAALLLLALTSLNAATLGTAGFVGIVITGGIFTLGGPCLFFKDSIGKCIPDSGLFHSRENSAILNRP